MKLSTKSWGTGFRQYDARQAAWRAPADLAGWQFACLGDSHMNGIDTVPTADAFAAVFGGSWVNLGVNGEESDLIAARVTALRDNRVRFAVVNGGINDFVHSYTLDKFLRSWKVIFDFCAENDIVLVALQMFPAAAYTNALHANRIAWNKQLEFLAANYPNAICPNLDKVLGKYRADGPDGNLYDVLTAYDLDTYHLNNAGNAALVSYLANSELPFPHFHLMRLESLLEIERASTNAPTMDPNGGDVTPGEEVTMTSTTAGALIRYTTDGSTPTPYHGELYLTGAKPVVAMPETLKAIAFKPFAAPSTVTTKNFTFAAGDTFPEFLFLDNEIASKVWLHAHFNGRLRQLCVPMSGDERYLASYGFFTPASGIETLCTMHICRPVIVTNHAAATKGGAGTWSSSGNAGARGGTYTYNETAGGTISFTVTGQYVGLYTSLLINGGYGLVSIDGNDTAANLCPTVTQGLIDTGKFLQADLGKAYVSTYSSSNTYDVFLPLANNLTDGEHTILLTATGTGAGSGTRLVVTNMAAATSTTTLDDAGAVPAFDYIVYDASLPAVAQVQSSALIPTYSSDQFTSYCGELHGQETASETVWLVDDVPTTPANGSTYGGDEIRFERTTSTTGNYSTKSLTLTADTTRAGRLKMICSITFHQTDLIRSGYALMVPTLKGSSLAFTHGIGATSQVVFNSNNQNKLETSAQNLCAAHSTWPWVIEGLVSDASMVGANADPVSWWWDKTGATAKGYIAYHYFQTVIPNQVWTVRGVFGMGYKLGVIT